MSVKTKSITMLKVLLAELTVSLILLFGAAYVIFKMSPSDQTISYIVIAIYVITSFVGGFLAGKTIKKKKYIWGLIAGVCYVLVILAVAFVCRGNVTSGTIGFIKMIVSSLVGGMLGGMAS